MFDKVKEFNEKNTTLYFFLAIIFLVVALFMNKGNKSNNDKPVIDNENTQMEVSKNYTYDVKLNKDNEIVLFTIKTFNNKYLITKTEKGIESIYYIYYSDVYEKDDTGNYILYRGNNFIDGIDNKLLFWDYICDIVDESVKIENDTKNCLLNNAYNFTICYNENEYDIKNDLYELNYKKYDIDNTKDFNISVNKEI